MFIPDAVQGRTLIVTDLHFDPNRQAGTTLETRAALSDWLLDEFEKLLLKVEHDSIVVVGDMLAKVTVSEKTLKRLFEILKKEKGYIMRGNHCQPSMKFGNISSLEFLCSLLPDITLVFNEPLTVGKLHFIPHCFNQEMFNNWILQVPENSWVFVHANFDNGFAVEADHSLNLSKEQLRYINNKGSIVILGHEHTVNLDRDGLYILGCTFPTSISDCLGGNKNFYVLTKDSLSSFQSWSKDYFIEIDYNELDNITSQRFIRINGSCEMEEYQQIQRTVSKLRAASSAFIISNNVKIKKKEQTITLADVTEFNVIEMLLKELPSQFVEDVRSCTFPE